MAKIAEGCVGDRVVTAARSSYGRLLAWLSHGFGDIESAEDALADALERALRTWPNAGIPQNPDAWLLTVARNRLKDRATSAEGRLVDSLDATHNVLSFDPEIDPDAIPDKRLELLLVCGHPDIPVSARMPLMLNTVMGFTAEQIARLVVIPTTTMSTRLTRAKKQIRDRHIPFALPNRSDMPDRMDSVIEAVYGAYVIDWSTAGVESRPGAIEALHLVEVLAEVAPDDPEVHGLAALVQLSAARSASRTDASGRFVPLDDQDPATWDRALIERAHHHLREAHRLGRPGRFQLEAAIQAVHCSRCDGQDVNWSTIRELYRALVDVGPSLGAHVALAAVTGRVDGPSAGLAVLDEIAERTSRFQPAWVTRAHLLAEYGDVTGATAAYTTAIQLTHEPAERAFLQERRAAIA